MLKAIELHGFKSFADRTRLEFDEGISAVVGPNGSGKSNIVDAIKWVLGERSVKKLRGSEMTDVIFSGSATRSAVATAEVTLSFDNSKRMFDLDTPEIHITRRINRSGESEYLVNRHPSRLKVIEDILGGTGLGSQAYSIIEQGRVESLLQSTPQQRRAIFEEAAGLSRFNAKKADAQRRLERIEQNLIRLRDKAGDKETQLKTAKAQAGKAQLYQQYTARFQELRVQSSLVDYRKNSLQSVAILEELQTLNEAEKETQELLERLEKEVQEKNDLVEEANRQSGRIEGEIVAIKEKISSEESSLASQREQLQTLDAEIFQHSRQLTDLNVRSVDAEEHTRKTGEEIRQSKKNHEEIRSTFQQHQETARQLAKELEQKRQYRATLRNDFEEKQRRISRLTGELQGLQNRVETLMQSQNQSRTKWELCTQQLQEAENALEQMRGLCVELRIQTKRWNDQVETSKRKKKNRMESLGELNQDLLADKQRFSGMKERISVLEELLNKHEGLNPGVKEVMRQSRNQKSPFRFVHGLVADLFRVDIDSAPLVDLALGPKSQHVVYSPEPEISQHILKTHEQLLGRVGFVWHNLNPDEYTQEFEGRPGVLGRADSFVETDPMYANLARHLLGHTWIVQDISVAKKLYRESDDKTNFLTVNGEYIAADGTLIVGPSSGASGQISRRSELRLLGEQLQALETKIQEKENRINVLNTRLSEEEQDFEDHLKKQQRTLSEFESKQLHLKNLEEQHGKMLLQQTQLQQETESLQTQLEKATDELREMNEQKEQLERDTATLEKEYEKFARELLEHEELHKEHAQKTTTVKIELAKSEERMDSLKDRIRQFEDRQQERRKSLKDHQKQIDKLARQHEQALLKILNGNASIAMLYVRKETLANSARSVYENRNELTARRQSVQAELKKAQQESGRIRNRTHAKQLERDRIAQEQKTLHGRMLEDYNIDLEDQATEDDTTDREATQTDQSLEQPLEEVAKEIESLRKKIQNLGAINMDALATLEKLEAEYAALFMPYDDIIKAKKNIETTIDQINVDTQQLFEKTFQEVRKNFQEIFQQLFGGGFADLKLEDEMNLLESGVEIMARPPGKELKSISLLSGGEKTMTCVALLFAFFRSSGNPVCILDEVDAALDEGNVDRFVRVVEEFQDQTQFLIVTHSKKTMACASTMYGITMQESGVSKPISVRFIDVGENGEILSIAEHDEKNAA